MNTLCFNYTIDPFTVKFKPVQNKVESFYNEVLNTAKYISSTTSKPILVAMSGGIDSEVAALGFLKSNIPFTAITVVHKNGSNRHDTLYANNFCKKWGVKQIHLVLDTEKFFFGGGIEPYMKNGYKARNVFRYFQLWLLSMIESLGYTGVLGGGEQIYNWANGKLCWSHDFSMLNAVEWCKNNNTLHYPYFFLTRSELVASYIKDPLVQFLINNTQYFDKNWYANMSYEKITVLHRYFEGMQRRRKFDGLENLSDRLDSEVHKTLKSKYSFPKIQVPIDILLKDLGI